MKLDLTEARKRVDDGLISCRQHPTLPLLVWNYSPKVQFNPSLWDEYTRMCRGLITDLEGNIVARPFPKFYNLGETDETKVENLPAEVPEVTEKLDGSLGVLFWDGDVPCISTRGSFESPQAQWATQWIRSRRGCSHQIPGVTGLSRYDFIAHHTYLFEIISKDNRIVVDYGPREELVLLAVRDTDTGKELPYDQLRTEASRLGLSVVRKIDAKEIAELELMLMAMNGFESEGFVVKYSNGLRLKMKAEDYLRLHRLFTGLSTISIWEELMNKGTVDAILEKCPDELYKWIQEVANDLLQKHNELMTRARTVLNGARDFDTRKEQAQYIINSEKDLSGIVFSLLDGRIPEAEKAAWKKLRPESRTYRVEK